LSEEYLIRLILEATLWALLAVALMAGSNLAGVALSADANFPNSRGNDEGFFAVEYTFYSVVPIVRIVYGLA